MQHGHQQHSHRLVEIDHRLHPGQREQVIRLAQVGVDRGDGHVVGQQRVGVQHHERVVIAVDHPGLAVRGLRDLVHVGHGGQAGADVQELSDPLVAGQMPHRSPQEPPVGAGGDRRARHGGQQLRRSFPVRRKVVLPA
jgi:hypothetical protein